MAAKNEDIRRDAAEKKIYSYLGLAQKAGKIAAGEFLTEKAIQEGKARLILVSKEASENTKKKFIDSATYYSVPVYLFGGKEELGHSLGKEIRASLAVQDNGFAKEIIKQLAYLNQEDQRRR